MARKTAVIVIDDEGRDKNKIFHLREMPARQAEQWATRAFLALARSGVDMPEGVQEAGFAGLAVMGFKALSQLKYEDIAPLMEEMFSCVTIQPDARHPQVIRALVDFGTDGDDIEEIATRLRLRAEVFNLHAGFSNAGVPQTSSISDSTPADSPNIKTAHRGPLARSSPPGKRR